MDPYPLDDSRTATYADAATRHGEATVTGDSAAANEAHDAIARIYRELREEGAEDRLPPLLGHHERSVVCWAAAHALEFAPEQGEPVLAGLARTSDILGLQR